MEILDFEKVLSLIRDLNPVQRVLLVTAGTLQGALTAYFGAPVEVRVVSQSQQEGNRIRREVSLVCPALKDRKVCKGVADITVEHEEVKRLILEGKQGLGRILISLGIVAAFNLEDVGADRENFWRTYTLTAPGIAYRIREDFPQALYPETGMPAQSPGGGDRQT